MTNERESQRLRVPGAWLCAAALLLLCVLPQAGAKPPGVLRSTWPEGYSFERNEAAGRLTLSTPYYTIQHDLKRGGVICSVRLTHGRATNLLAAPFQTRIEDAAGQTYSDLHDPAPRVTIGQKGLAEVVTVQSELLSEQGKPSGIRLKTVYEYRWGYVKIHKLLTFPGKGFRAKAICPVSVVLAPSLSAYGYRDGLMEEEGALPFTFGSCHWGRVRPEMAPALDTRYVPRYAMFVNPGVEGLEWFVSDDLAQWDLQVDGKRGQGRSVLRASAKPAGIAFSVSAFQTARSPVTVPAPLAFGAAAK